MAGVDQRSRELRWDFEDHRSSVGREAKRVVGNFEVGVLGERQSDIAAIAAAVLQKPIDDEECVIRAHAILGQIVVFGIARVVLWKRLNWDGYSPERVATIAEIATQSLLNSLELSSSKSSPDEGN